MKILFVCNGNTGRSQMAETLTKKYFPKYEVQSAGVNVREKEGQKLPIIMLETLAKEGIDGKGLRKKQLTIDKCLISDKIVWMTHKEDIPKKLEKEIIYWDIENPKNTSLEKHVKIMNIIKQKIIQEL